MTKLKPFLFFFCLFSFTATAQISLSLDGSAERIPINITDAPLSIELCELTVGHQYEITALADDSDCVIHVLNNNSATTIFNFVATSSCRTLTFKKQCPGKLFAYVSVADLSAELPDLTGAEDNLTVEHGLSAEELVQGVLIGNNCSIDLNVQQHGNDVQFGTFAQGLSSIGFDSGIIISTGNISNAPGPNNSSSKGTNVPGNNSDNDLNNIATEDTYDAAVIEFDFTPITTEVQFEYVFASEEYCEFVNKDYNDVFGFFISGPGISGTKNIAEVPGTGENVSIDNINHLKNSSFFIPNSSSCSGITNSTDIQFDGYTQPLVAKATVIPCETYHIKLAIADVGDGIYDSAVFLKAGSFDAGDIVSVTPESTINQTQNALEGCDNGYLLFDRSCSNDINQPLTLSIEVLPSGTAKEGIDFVALPTTITIPAGATRDSIPIFAIDDGMDEGDETIVVEITGQYPCYKPTAVITISDKIPVIVQGMDTTLCENTSATLRPTIQAGIAPYSYQWNTGDTSSQLTQNFSSSQSITCTVSDVCHNTDLAEFNVSLIPPSSGKISGDATLCDPTSQAQINLSFTGAGPWDVTIEKDNATLFTKQYSQETSSFDVNQSGLYRIASISSYGCAGTPEGEANIKNTTLDASYVSKDVSCYGLADGSITAQAKNGTLPYVIQWSVPASNSMFLDGLTAKNYSFVITDGDGCTVEKTITLTEPEPLVLDTLEVHHVNCFSPQGGFIKTTTKGGTTPYQYAWNTGELTADNQDLPEGNYIEVVTDAQGCQDSIQVAIIGDFVKPIIEVHPADTINCYHASVVLSGLGSSTGGQYSYSWTTPNGHIVSDPTSLQPTVNQAGIYQLTISNSQNGCSASASVQTVSDQSLPEIDAGDEFALNCTDTTTIIGIENNHSNYVFSWTTNNGHFLESIKKPQTIVDRPGQYNLWVQNLTNGCTNTDSVVITEIAARPNAVSLSTQDPTCIGYDGQITINRVEGGSPPYLYSFDGGQSFHDTITNATLNYGAHDVVIQDIYGCEYHQLVDLKAPIPPVLNVTPEHIIEMGDHVFIHANASVLATELDSIIWTPVPDTLCPHCLTADASPYSTTTYHLRIVDSLHCEANADILVLVEDPDVYIPNAFSPDGERQGNSSFTIYGNPSRIKQVRNLHVYDRWGSQVFRRDNFSPNVLSLGWDGSYRDKKSPPGVYIYAAEVELINGEIRRFKGDVTLVR